MAPSFAFRNGDYAGRDYTRESVTEIAATMASRLARSRESGGVLASDTQEAETIARKDHWHACESDRLDEKGRGKTGCPTDGLRPAALHQTKRR